VRHIAKAREPSELTEYRSRPGARYDGDSGFPVVKDAIRVRLVAEQRGLCCFCERAITAGPTAMRIAHRVPQSVAPDRDLDWRNLLGACTGNEGGGDPHCDVAQGDRAIQIDPTQAEHVATVGFTKDRRITSSRAEFQAELDDALRLNCERLLGDRGRALAEYIKQRGLAARGGIDRKTLERWRDALDSPQLGNLPPFASLLRAWLNRQLQARG
jgi:uncharacterized protein (TIGR02646 family)